MLVARGRARQRRVWMKTLQTGLKLGVGLPGHGSGYRFGQSTAGEAAVNEQLAALEDCRSWSRLIARAAFAVSLAGSARLKITDGAEIIYSGDEWPAKQSVQVHGDPSSSGGRAGLQRRSGRACRVRLASLPGRGTEKDISVRDNPPPAQAGLSHKHNEHQETRRTRRTAVWPAG